MALELFGSISGNVDSVLLTVPNPVEFWTVWLSTSGVGASSVYIKDIGSGLTINLASIFEQGVITRTFPVGTVPFPAASAGLEIHLSQNAAAGVTCQGGVTYG